MYRKVNSTNKFIETCGVIACGKTSFTKLLKTINFASIFEKFSKNPFLSSFYLDPSFFSFETEITFLLQHYNQIKINKNKNKNFICDFSLTLDMAFADVTLNSNERKAFIGVFKELKRQVYYPDAIVYLKCNPKVLLKRIESRGRDIEKSIDISYLKEIDTALSHRIKEIDNKVKIIEINSGDYNFVDDKKAKDYVLNIVSSEIFV